MFGQTFAPADLATVAMLVVLEGLLSIDNALVLGVMAQRVDPTRRIKALAYGLVGAFVLRVAMISLAAYLLKWSILKLAGGLYLLWVAGRHFIRGWQGHRESNRPLTQTPMPFWSAVAAIELTDVAFAVDSILAAVALVGPGPIGVIHPKLWVIILGGMLGVALMRFAAALFARILERFPGFQRSAYLLVLLIGFKLLADWACNSQADPHRIDFQNPRGAAMWVFWGGMLICLCMGLPGPDRRKINER